MQIYHGSSKAMVPHIGLCLAACEIAAGSYGEIVTQAWLDTAGLNILEVEITQEMYDNNDYPGDTAAGIAALAADGVDVVTYQDCSPTGLPHVTYRIITERALAALSYEK